MPRVLNSGEISQKVSSVHFWGIIRFIPQAVRFIVGIIHQKAVLRSLRSPETPFLAPFRLNLMRILKNEFQSTFFTYGNSVTKCFETCFLLSTPKALAWATFEQTQTISQTSLLYNRLQVRNLRLRVVNDTRT